MRFVVQLCFEKEVLKLILAGKVTNNLSALIKVAEHSEN